MTISEAEARLTARRERHGSSNDYGESQPSRTQQTTEIVDEELLLDTPLAQPKPAPGKKDKDLCKQNHWQPHGYELRVRQYGWAKRKTCRWHAAWTPGGYQIRWYCGHEAYCPYCGKNLERRMPAAACPDWAEITETERASLEQAIAGRAVRRARRKMITGPSHYRKKKTR